MIAMLAIVWWYGVIFVKTDVLISMNHQFWQDSRFQDFTVLHPLGDLWYLIPWWLVYHRVHHYNPWLHLLHDAELANYHISSAVLTKMLKSNQEKSLNIARSHTINTSIIYLFVLRKERISMLLMVKITLMYILTKYFFSLYVMIFFS